MKFFFAPVALLMNAATRVDAHGWLVQPVSRETSAQEDASGSVGCPNTSPGKSTSVQPGQKINVRYQRNNHVGGFIRWSIAPRGQESKTNFDNNVFFYTCRESGSTCLPQGENEVYSGDNGAPANSILCGDTITLPDWLPAGDYVLQWTWMSVGASYGNIAWANPQYRSCADLKFTSAGTGQKTSCPTFVGGDRVTKLQNKGSDQCFYFYTNDMATSVYKADASQRDALYKFGVPAQVAKCAPGGGNSGGGNNGGGNNSGEDGNKGNDSEGPGSGGGNNSNGTAGKGNSSKGNNGKSSSGRGNKGRGNSGGSAPAAKNATGNGTVRPSAAKKGEWELCSENSECENGCCANKYSDDGQMKCTPGGC